MEALQSHPGTSTDAVRSGFDAALLAAAQQGQPGAFDDLMVTYRPRVYRQCLRRGLNEDEAADLTQDVFLKAFRSLGRYQHQHAFSTWLYRITENTWIDHCRKRGRSRAVLQPITIEENGLEHEFPSQRPDPQETLEGNELQEQIATALAALRPILRDTFLLKERDGLRYEQIAARLGCTLGTVKSRIFRARRELADQLRPLL